MSSCAKIFGQGNLTAALCFAPSPSVQWPKGQGSRCPGLQGFFHPSPNFHPLSWSLISRLHTEISHFYFVLTVPSRFLYFWVFLHVCCFSDVCTSAKCASFLRAGSSLYVYLGFWDSWRCVNIETWWFKPCKVWTISLICQKAMDMSK